MVRAITKFIIVLLLAQGVRCEAQDQGDPIKIGVCLAMTGEAAKWSAAHRAGMELAVDDYMKRGVTLDVIWEDTGTTTAGSVTCYRRMTSVERVSAVVGNIWGFLTLPLGPLAEGTKVPVVSSGFFRESCSKAGNYLFSVSEQVSDLAPTFSAFLQNHPEFSRVGVAAFDDDEWGKINTEAVGQAAKAGGRELVAVVKTQEMKPDYRLFVLPVISKKPDIIFVFHEPLATTKALRELGFKGAIVQSNAIGEQLWDSGRAPEIFEGVYFADQEMPESFRVKFKERFGKEPILEPHSGYDAMTVAIESALVNEHNPSEVIRSRVFKGVMQPMDFRNSCAAKRSVWRMFRIKDGLPVSTN